MGDEFIYLARGSGGVARARAETRRSDPRHRFEHVTIVAARARADAAKAEKKP